MWYNKYGIISLFGGVYMEQRFYSAKDIQQITNCSRSLVYSWLHRADFPKVKIGNRIIVPIDAFERWIADQMKQS